MGGAVRTHAPVRPRRLSLEPGLIAAGLIGMLAAWPFLSRPGLPVFSDAEQHAYRAFQVIETLRAGVPYARWAPDFFHGYGYPVFNYYAPLTYYLGAAYGWLLGEGGAAAGVKLVFVAAFGLGSVGMYAFARLVWSRPAGIAAAASFTLAPYCLFHNPHLLGRAPELFAIALAPLLFWGFTRLRHTASPGAIALAASVLAIDLLSHNLMPLIFASLLLVWLAWTAWTHPLPVGRRTFALAAGVALAVGVAVSLFFWAPAGIESGAIQLGNAVQGPYLSYRGSFVPLATLLSPARAADVLNLRELNFKLGLAQWVLAMLGALTLAAPQPRAARAATTYFAMIGGVVVFLILPTSTPVWDRVGVLAFVQFPSRLLGPAAFLLAGLCGAAVEWMGHWRGPGARTGASAVALAACLLAALPLLNPLPWADFGPVNMQRLRQAELEWEVGTTASNEFLPVTVISAPGPAPSLSDSYAAGSVDKVNRAALPEGAEVAVIEHGPLHDQLAIDSPSDFTLRLYTFDFPGWTAYVDGAAVPITPSGPEGWITLAVPRGKHTVRVQLEDTAPRRLGWLASGLGLAALVGLGGWQIARRQARRHDATTTPGTRVAPEGAEGWLLPGLALTGLVAGIGLNAANWPYATQTYAPVQPQQAQAAHWSSGVELLGYDLMQTTLRPGDSVDLTLYWAAYAPTTANSRVFVHLIGPEGQLWANSDKFHPGEYEDLPTGRWPVGRPLTDVHTLVIPPDTPPGEYHLQVGLWDGYTGERVPLLIEEGPQPPPDALPLPDIIRVN